jgi:hypothetical protein
VPLVVLAAYGLTLRAQQSGWTPPRIIAGVCIVVAGCYAVGYAIAALRPNLALKGLEPTNVVTGYVIVAVVLCLFSPIADPSRVAVADQLRRVESEKETPETFDFKLLRFNSGRYGKAPLERLAQAVEGANAAAISEKAKQAMLMARLTPQRRWDDELRPSASQRAENITVVHPRGQALPDGFLRQVWTKEKPWRLPRCLITVGAKCQAVLLDLYGERRTSPKAHNKKGSLS